MDPPTNPRHSSSAYSEHLNRILWNLMDDRAKSSPYISHERLCAIRKIWLELAVRSGPYITRDILIDYIRDATSDNKWYTYASAETFMNESNTVPTSIEGDKPSLITEIIQADCHECFMCLESTLSGLDTTCVNENGWSLMAMVAYFGSMKMIKYFCKSPSPNGSCISLLTRNANVTHGPTTLVMISIQRKLNFLRDLFTFLSPRFQELKQPYGITGDLTAEEKYHLCSFLTPELADDFERIGVPLYNACNTWSSGANAYHAAVSNGPEFLDYLHARSSLSMKAIDNSNETPLHYAIRANRVGSVLWLKAHGAVEFQNNCTTNTPAHLAAYSTTEDSIIMLNALLPTPGLCQVNSVGVSTMLTALVEGLRDVILAQLPHSDPFNMASYLEFKQVHEDRAVMKCKLIRNVATDEVFLSGQMAGYEHGFYAFAIKWYHCALEKTRLLGFDKLAAAMERTYGENIAAYEKMNVMLGSMHIM